MSLKSELPRLGACAVPLTSMFIASGLAAGICSTSLANVSINEWLNSSNFHHRRTGIPDQDQKRVGLPNSGGCYCVPTSVMNTLIYVANHGYASVTPGPGDYSDYDHYYDITNLLEDIGDQANVSPGGDDPDDPDCNNNDGQGNGSDGECGSLPCGTSYESVYNAMLALDWLGNAEDDLVWTARFLDDNAPATNFANLGKLGYQGNVVCFAYGRYKVVGTGPFDVPIYKRSGGHSVTMNEAYSDGNDQQLFSRDPAQDEGDIFGPSPYATKQYDITPVYILVTSDDEAPFSFTLKSLSALDEPQDDGVKRCIDGYLAVKPESGIFWKDQNFVMNLPLSIQFGGGAVPSTFPIPFSSVKDLVLDQDQIGWLALFAGNEVTPAQLVQIDPVNGTTTPLVDTNATRLVLGRKGDIYTMQAGSNMLRQYRLDPEVSPEEAQAELLGEFALAVPPSALAYDDEGDRLCVLIANTSGFGGTLHEFPRHIDSEVEPVLSYVIPPTVQLGGAVRMAVSPTGLRWVSAKNAGKAFGLKKPSAPGGTMIVVESIAGFDSLTSVELDDSNTLYAVDDGAVKVFERTRTGAWSPADSSAFEGVDVGEVLRLTRSRTNFDPAIHDTEAWNNFVPDEIEDIGQTIPDCLGDLNGDGVVDGGDYGLLLATWGSGGPNVTADLNSDGTVDGSDLGLLLGEWGECE